MTTVSSMEDINKEEVFDLLQSFEEKSSESEKIPEPLENYLKYVAQTGDILYPWLNIKPLIRKKVEVVLEEFHEQHPMPALTPPFNFEELKKEIVETLDGFSGAPFTIQRICELLTLPTKHYKRTDKFMRGLEKNVLVVSHADPTLPADQRPPSPPKSIFAPEPSYHLFERSLSADPGHSSNNLQASTSSASTSHDSLPGSSSSDVSRAYSEHEAGTSCASSKIILPSMNMSCSSSPAPLQQLDSFTTVFSSPPSTPLAVVSNMGPIDSASSSSSSSSSGSSSESSPQPQGDPSSPEELDRAEPCHELESQTSSRESSSSSEMNEEPTQLGNQTQEQAVVPESSLETMSVAEEIAAAVIVASSEAVTMVVDVNSAPVSESMDVGAVGKDETVVGTDSAVSENKTILPEPEKSASEDGMERVETEVKVAEAPVDQEFEGTIV